MAAVATVSSMAEHVQQRAGEKKQIWQNSQDMSPVLGKEQRSPHGKKGEEDESAARGPEAASCRSLGMRMIVVCHINLLIQR